MTFYSQAWQDECVINLLNFKRNGSFIDIGSGDGMNQSNSFFFEKEMGWKGICVERGVGYTEHYKNNRNCLFLNEDATQIDYRVLFNVSMPKRIDYLSVDIDEGTANVFKLIPFDTYRFSVITVEHDGYRFGDALRNEERTILNRCGGYTLLFPDVLVPMGCGMGPDLPFEDWWVDSKVFNMDKLHSVCGSRLYPDNICTMLKTMPKDFIL